MFKTRPPRYSAEAPVPSAMACGKMRLGRGHEGEAPPETCTDLSGRSHLQNKIRFPPRRHYTTRYGAVSPGPAQGT